MKISTNIKHKNKLGEYCSANLMREFWGEDEHGHSEWNMTCTICGFRQLISNEIFLKWQYCDKVIEE